MLDVASHRKRGAEAVADGAAVEVLARPGQAASEYLMSGEGGSRVVLVGARMPAALRDDLAARAAVSDRSFSAELRRAVASYLEIDDVTVSALLAGDHRSTKM